ncbi:hypothetical protein M5K25_028431 [Dendrobium thyrsiflorum]|uniref:Branchpoint-bridging protein n=1 Tax=Dendrobium thyrsiflorum TaxID=117978 RepID=A0ABD0TTA2_DENTH
MGSYDGNAIAVSRDSAGIGEKSELVPKSNHTEDERAEQICSDEPAQSKEEELSRKHKREPYEEAEDVLSRAYINYLIDGSEGCRLNLSATSSERKKRSGDLLDDLMQKRQKHHMISDDMYANLNMRKLIADRIVIQKHERSGSSGKRSRDSFDSEAGLEGQSVSGDDSVSKRRKLGHAGGNMQLKMLGPLKLPDYVEGFKYDHKLYPEIIKLNKQLMEINKKLRARGTIDNCPEDEHSPSPPPIYNERGVRVNTRVNRLWKKLGHRRQQIICELNQKNPLFLPPLEERPAKFSRKLYIPVKQYPNYNFIGLIIGPRGHTQKRMERESGANILLRGKGSTRLKKVKQYKDRKTEPFEDEDLHVYIEAADEKSLESASAMVEKLLVPVNEEMNEHKHAQLKELAELNSEISSEALNSTTQNNVAYYTRDDEKPVTSLSSLNPTNLGPAPEIENNSHQPALVSLRNCMINSEFGALTSHDDSKLDSAAGALLLSHKTKPGEVIDKAKLFVGFLPLSVNTEKLIELFLPFGRLCEAVVIMDRRTGLSKGYGFVKYIDPLSAAEALVQMNGYRVDGKIITVRIAGRAPLNVNTIIGPRALRFANQPSSLVSAATCPSTFSQGVLKGWNNWVVLPQPNAFPFCADSMYRRPHLFTEPSERCPVRPSLIFGGPASSIEFVPFSCYQNVAKSLD